MSFYNRLKQIITYINFFFGIYLWLLIFYAFLRETSLIKKIPIFQEHGLGYYLATPIKYILSSF